MSTRRTLLLASGQSIDLSEYLLKSEAETLYAPLDAIVNKQDKLISGTNIKTINGQSIVGSGNLVIEDGTYIFEWDGSERGTITQDQWDALQNAKNIVVKRSSNLKVLTNTEKSSSRIIAAVFEQFFSFKYINIAQFTFNSDLTYNTVDVTVQLIRSGDLKTINGESLEGSGDIVISGGSSSGSGAYPEIDGSIYKDEESPGEVYAPGDLLPNTFYVFPECTVLAIHGFIETSGVANEYIFQFTSGSTATTLSLPDDIKWTGGETPTIEANKIYQVSILKGLGSVLEWDSVSLIENKLTLTDGDMMSGSVLTFAYPTASELTLTMKYYSSDTLIVPSGTTSITIDWNEPMAPQIIDINPTSDSTYKYIM